jgi:hypothetical protein
MVDCGETISLTREQADAIASYATAATSGGGAVLVAAIDGGDSVVACVRGSGGWTAYQVADNGGVDGVYRSDRGDIFAWAYLGRGDPPYGYAGLHLPASGSGRFCTSIDTPDELNKPGWQGEYLSFAAFNVAEDDSGAIVGSAEVERTGQPETWTFRYDTADGGRHWADPIRVEEGTEVAGLYSRVDEQDEALLEDLRNSLA